MISAYAFAAYRLVPSTIRILNANQSIQSNEHLDVVDIKNKLGVEIPLELMFKDENNNEVSLGKYFDGNKPVILTLA